MPERDAEKMKAWDRVIAPWWAKLGIGTLMVVLSIWEFGRIRAYEAGERELYTLGRSTRVLYGLGGIWLPTGIAMLVGAGFVAWGVVQIVKGKQ